MFAKQTGYMPLEPTVGMLIAVPCVLFGAVAVAGAVRLAAVRAQRNGAGPATEARDRLYLWLVSACLAITLLAGVPALGMHFSTMRFLADFTSAALVLAAIGFWTLPPARDPPAAAGRSPASARCSASTRCCSAS